MKNEKYFKKDSNSNSFKEAERPSLDFAFMQFAKTVSKRSTCHRKQVGAVFVDKDKKRIMCFGYNGGCAHEAIEGCDRTDPGNCGCIHAEINALTKNTADLTGAICYLTLSPCAVCAKVIYNSGISKVYYLDDYRDRGGLDILEEKGVEIIHVGFSDSGDD